MYRLSDEINNEGLLIYPTTPVDIDGDGLANTEECTFFAYDPGYDGSTSCIGYLWLTIPEATYIVGGIAKPNYREYEEFSYFIELNGKNYLAWEKSGIYNEDGEEGTVIYSGNADVSYYVKSEIVFNDLSTIFDSNKILNPGPFFFKYMFYTADGTLTGVYLATNGAHYASLNQENEDKYIELINKQNRENGIWGNDISEEYNEDYDEFIVALNHNFEERGIDNFIDWINQEQKDINVICGLKYIPEDSAYVLPWQAAHSPKKMTNDKLNMQVSYCYNNSLYIEKEGYSEDEIEYLEEETKVQEENTGYLSGYDKILGLYGMWKLRDADPEYYYFNYLGEVRGYRINGEQEIVEDEYWQWRLDENEILGIGVKGEEDILSAYDVSDKELIIYNADGNTIYFDRISDVYTSEYDELIGVWISDEDTNVELHINEDLSYSFSGGQVIDRDINGNPNCEYCIFDNHFCSSDEGIGIKIREYKVEGNKLIIGTSSFTKEK